MSDDQIEEQGHGGHSSASFTDLMASLMVIFILLFVATVQNESAKHTTIRNNLRDSLLTSLSKRNIAIDTVAGDPYAVVIVFKGDLLFHTDSDSLLPNGNQALRDVVPSLAGLLCSSGFANDIDYVVVEGHTDTTFAGKITPQKPDTGRAYNLRLSQRRSMAVVSAALGTLNMPERDCFRSKVSASGRGQEEPLPGVPGDSEQQRRVVFKIRVRAGLAGEVPSGRPSTPGAAPPSGSGTSAATTSP